MDIFGGLAATLELHLGVKLELEIVDFLILATLHNRHLH